MSLSLAGLREDGRRPGELRHVRVRVGGAGFDGSCYLEMGQTRVLAQVLGPHEPDRKAPDAHTHAALRVELTVAPFAAPGDRKRRRPGDRKMVELAMAVEESLRVAVMTELYPQTQIDVFITVLQDDGSRLPACINAASLAMIDAGVSTEDMLVACSAGIIDGQPCVDLTNREQGQDTPFLPLVLLPREEHVVLAQVDAKLPLDALDPVLAAAVSGCHQVHSVLSEATRQHTEALLASNVPR